MRSELKKGYKLIFAEKRDEFIIKDALGRGASCLVYLAETIAGNNIRYSIIKEFNPIKLELQRDDTGAFVIPEEKTEQYSFLLERFKSGYEKQQQIRVINDLTNATSNIQGIYHANNTEYIEMTYFNGKTYSVENERNLYDFFRRMKALTQVIANYHNAGFLHLDIKPDNIYVLPETPEMVMLFDFDSVVEKNSVIGNSPLSYTKDWAAIEQIDVKRRREICEATDLFAVGETIFYYFFGRHSDIGERRSFSKYYFDYGNSIFDSINPLVTEHLNDLFHKTLCNIVDNRYQNAEDLIDKLDILISLSNPNIPFLKSNTPSPTNYFIGRDDEIDCIHKKLKENNLLFISGIGGIGKSELVKHYAKKYIEDYDAIIFAPFISDVFNLITDDAALPICNFKQFPEEKAEEYYDRKLRKLKELCNDNTLIIVDNFDNAEELDKLLELNCKMLFTTRCDFSDSYAQIDLNALKERRHISDIFNNFYVKPLSAEEKAAVEKIIDIVEGHTMTVELLAKQMMAGRVSPQKMLERLTEGGIADSGKEKIRISKDASLKTGNAYSHIQTLFDLSELNDDEIFVLANLSLIPHTGISTELFCKWCEIDNYDTINSLTNEGWVRINKEKDYISLHPVIADIVSGYAELHCDLEYAILKQTISHPENDTTVTSLEEGNEKATLLRAIATKVISITTEKEYVVDFLYQMGLLNWRCGYLNEAISCTGRALEIFVKTDSKNSYRLFEIYFSIGILYKAKNNYKEAEQIFLYIINTILIKHKKSYQEIAEVHQECGYLYLEQGMCKKALKYLKYAISMYLKIKKGNTLEYANICGSIGTLYEELDNLSKAKKYFYEQLNISKSILGDSSVEIAKIYKKIGEIHRKLKENSTAKFFDNKALEIYSRHGSVSNSIEICKSLASLRSSEKNFTESIKYYKQAIELSIRLYGEENTNVARLYNELAYTFDYVGDIKSTEFFLLKALEIFEKINDNDHMDLGTQYSDVATVYARQGDYKNAEKYLWKSLEVAKNIFGSKNVIVGNILSMIGNICENQEKHIEAYECYENALSIWNSVEDNDMDNIKEINARLKLLRGMINNEQRNKKDFK